MKTAHEIKENENKKAMSKKDKDGCCVEEKNDTTYKPGAAKKPNDRDCESDQEEKDLHECSSSGMQKEKTRQPQRS